MQVSEVSPQMSLAASGAVSVAILMPTQLLLDLNGWPWPCQEVALQRP